MSILRISARLPLRSCLQAANTKCQRDIKRQDNFEGVLNAYFWDEKTGFGTTKGGNTVLVSQDYKKGCDLSTKSESELWQEIIDPTSYISHEALRDELQMNVLSYDDDVVTRDTFTEQTTVQTLPIYKGDISMLTSNEENPPGGQSAGSSSGSRTAIA